MKLSLIDTFQQPEGKSAKQVLEESFQLAQQAEALGCDGYWMAEHHFSNYGIMGSPLLFAAAVAQRTKTIKIGIGILVLPLYDPVRLAEECALADVLCDGRLQVGVGRGYQPAEFAGFRVDQGKSRALADEVQEILELAWTQEKFSYEGEFFKLSNLSILPRPIQQPHPPIYKAASSMESFQAAGEKGMRILTSPNITPLDTMRRQFETYEAALSAAGFDPKLYSKPVMQKVYIGTDADDAHETPREPALRFHRQLATHVLPPEGEKPKGYEVWDKISKNMAEITYEKILEHGSIFATPDVAAEKLRELQGIGVDTFLAFPRFGGMPHDKLMASMERLALDVMPRLQPQHA